jgi:hypothetical protein
LVLSPIDNRHNIFFKKKEKKKYRLDEDLLKFRPPKREDYRTTLDCPRQAAELHRLFFWVLKFL